MLKREDLLKKPVKDINLKPGMRVSELVVEFRKIGGFMAKNLATAASIFEEMIKDEKCTIFLSFTANIIATGLRSVITALIKYGFIDVIVTTGGSIDHDIARSCGGVYYQGEFNYDDIMLRDLEIHRLGNVLVPMESYGLVIERFTLKALEELCKIKSEWTVSELLYEIGKRINREDSFLFQAYKRGVPVFSPGIVDSSFGTNIMSFIELGRSRGYKFKLDIVSDLKRIYEIVMSSNKIGALIIGGGISKHHVIWWSQFKGGLDYAIYITTAVEWDGSLSGAQPREAISWNKIKPRAKHVVVYGDATIILPVIVLYAIDRLKEEGINERKNSSAIKGVFNDIRH